jgi:energy-coupling factor transporter transmembrane protein EcfT
MSRTATSSVPAGADAASLTGGLLGSGRGLLTRSQPPLRLAHGILAVSAVIAAPAAQPPGAVFIAGAALLTVLLAKPPLRVIRRTLLFGAALYVPLLAILLLPVFLGFGDVALPQALRIAAVIALKGMATLLVTLTVVSTLAAAELHVALGALPVPRVMRLVLIQIVHQTGILLDETTRITQVLRVRAHGARGAWRVAASLPRAWLERIAGRAARTGDAMEVRGYVHLAREPFPHLTGWHASDWIAVTTGVIMVAAAVTLLVVR